MKSCPKCRKSGPGSRDPPGTRTRRSRKWLDLRQVEVSTGPRPPRPSMATVLERVKKSVRWYIGNCMGL
eukprot:6495143-Prymnesium_polylepis.1